MFDHIIFDVDGTLIDSADAVVGTLLHVSRECMPSPASESRCRETLSMNTVAALRYIGVAESSLKKAVRRYDVLYASAYRTTPFQGVPEMLASISAARIPMALLSARKAYEFHNDTALAPLLPYFHMVMGAEFAAPKPSPEGLLRYMQMFHTEPERVLFVGDTPADSRCALAASVPFALAGWNAEADPGITDYRYLLREPGDLPAVLRVAGMQA